VEPRDAGPTGIRRPFVRQRTIQHAGFLFLLVLVTLAFGVLISNFVTVVFWAAVLAIVFRPVERALDTRFGNKRPNASAALTTVLVVLVVFIPLGFIGVAVSREAVDIYQRFSSGELAVSDAIDRWVPALVRLGAQVGITPATVRTNVADAATSIAQFLASGAVTAGQNAVRAFGQFFLMLYVLFFFLRDGDQLLRAIARALPLGDARERALFERFTAVTRATLKGTLVVGAVQGTLGAIFFALLGLEGPVFWGAMMWAGSLIPVIGPTIIWLPASIYLLLTGAVAKGLLLLGLGTFGIALADNILRPILVGRETRMPDYVVLLSTLGGLGLFGLSGFVAGPAIAALFITAWDMFAREYATSDRTTKA
jgi:predicted PurR-regulated permease PerM